MNDFGAAYLSATAGVDHTALESRAEVESLETLHTERRKLIARLAPLKAMHGSFGMFDAKRQQMGRAMMVKAKQEMTARGEKVTDQMVEAHALTDPQYAAFLDQHVRDKIEFITLQTQLDEIEERIRNREIALQCYNGEIRLGR